MKRAKMIRRETELLMVACHARDKARIDILQRVVEGEKDRRYIDKALVEQIFGWEHKEEAEDE